MCGIAGIFGNGWSTAQLGSMLKVQRHRGPDSEGIWTDGTRAGLGHTRLSIIDLTDAASQPMASACGNLRITFNGEIYNYVELKQQLAGYPFRTSSDTEVILAAYDRWGEACLDRLIGMFAFAIWDRRSQSLFAARDRFGVKPLYYHAGASSLILASEIKALHAAGAPKSPNPEAWACYLRTGLYDHSEGTFWENIRSVPPGHFLRWREGRLEIRCWYDIAERVGTDYDTRGIDEVSEEYTTLLEESVRLRFRSDVPVGINLSGGLDSSILAGLVRRVQGAESEVTVFTYVTGDERYDELPWVQKMLAKTRHPLVVSRLEAKDVPDLAASLHRSEEEPYGGLPTLTYARLFEDARAAGTIVLLDGQGMDEQWAGYSYYESALATGQAGLVQGTSDSPVRPHCLIPEFAASAAVWDQPKPFPDALRNTQYRDIRHTKIPRALRFNDRASMRSSTELREPFLDHRLVELALRQAPDRKIADGTRKWLLRKIASQILPSEIVEAPKRPLQTPQREWLRGPLREWAGDRIDEALRAQGGAWFDRRTVAAEWENFLEGGADNSFYVWQWISVGLLSSASCN